VKITVYRVSDRGIGAMSRYDRFQGALSSYTIRSVVSENAAQVWTGEMPVQLARNETVTTLFPIRQAIGEHRPGVALVVARDAAQQQLQRRQRNEDDDDDSGLGSGALAGQWVLETDIGVTTFTANDGLNVFVRSLNTARPMQGVEVSLVARNNDE